MNYKCPAGFILTASLFFALPVCAQHGGFGHAGGGHSFGGHLGSGGGHSAGHSIGHSVGHSFGHVFGRHAGGAKGSPVSRANSEEPPLAGAAMIRGRVVQLANPQGVPVLRRPLLHRRPITEFGFPRHSGFFFFGNNFFLGFCEPSFGFSTRPLFFGRDFACFDRGFFFDPFFAGFDPLIMGTPDPGVPTDLGFSPSDVPPRNVEPDDQNPSLPTEPVQGSRLPKPDTLLQLTNGSMYALTRYWLDGDRIHYITSYGGENSVPISQIDFDKTIQLNSDQGVKFELRPKPAGN